MPIPQPKDNEKQNDYMGRCMHKIAEDKMPNKQKVAICLNTYNNPKKKSKANEMEIDFTEDIKNMNKQQEVKVEAPKVEAKIEAPANTAVTAPSPEIQSEAVKIEVPKTAVPKLPAEPKKIETPKFEPQQKTEHSKEPVWMEQGSVQKEVKAETDGKGELIQTTMLQMQKQYQIFHWQTTSFSQHKSFGKIYESLDESIDTFIETYMGKYGRVISASKFNLEMSNYSDLNFATATDSYIEFLINLTNMLDAARDTDLLNIRDEILGNLNRLKYLLTLV
jgi:DNA-binding ferritin-like protein